MGRYPQVRFYQFVCHLSIIAVKNVHFEVTTQPGICPGPRQEAFRSQYQIRFVSRTYRCFNFFVYPSLL